MKRRATDERDKISEQEVKEARIPWWKAIKLFIANLPLIAKVIMLIIGVAGGTVAAPEAVRLLDQYMAKPLPTPKDALPPPPSISNIAGSAFQAQAAQSFTALTNASNAHKAELEALREEIRNLEARVSAQRARGDSSVSERVTANSEAIQTLQGIVQP